MALSGIAIYKLLPQTNCKECGHPTCLAFAMKLAARQAELAACPYVSDEAKAQLDNASAPPVRLISLGSGERKFEVGNETVVFRHEKTFVHQPGLFLRLPAGMADADFEAKLQQVADYKVERVGQTLRPDGVAIEAGASAEAFAARVKKVTE
jgi:acetyl-CoA decarbonylase/synthase, CODH/ACS complex subunit gamma